MTRLFGQRFVGHGFVVICVGGLTRRSNTPAYGLQNNRAISQHWVRESERFGTLSLETIGETIQVDARSQSSKPCIPNDVTSTATEGSIQ
jgi:hypothetical protein